MRGDGRIFLRNGIYWCAYYLNGEEHRESTKQTDEKEAQKYLSRVLKQVHAAQIGARTFTTPKSSRLTIGDLVAALRTRLELDGKLSAQNKSELERIDKGLMDSEGRVIYRGLGAYRAVQLTTEEIQRYVQERLESGAARATVNRLLTFLIRCYTLAIENRHLSPQDCPTIKLLPVNNARKGFFNRADFDKVHAHLPADLQDYCLFAFLSAWRKSEISSLTWSNVHDGVIRLQAEDAKNNEGRSIVISGELVQVIERREAAALAAQREAAPGIVPIKPERDHFIFNRNGEPIKEFRKAWASACRKAGFGGRIFHDLRRSGVRQLIRSGVPQNVAMKISGHKTISMFRRYDICNEDDLKAAMENVERFQQAQTSNVVAMTK